MELMNATTGKPATKQEYAQGLERAKEIMHHPYASPELMAWAMNFPEAIEDLVFWQAHKVS